MKYPEFNSLCFFIPILISLFSQYLVVAEPRVPCFFIFGDSIVDNGNNNFRQTTSRADFLPYGIDFPGGPTGRFSNGRNFADILGLYSVSLSNLVLGVKHLYHPLFWQLNYWGLRNTSRDMQTLRMKILSEEWITGRAEQEFLMKLEEHLYVLSHCSCIPRATIHKYIYTFL